MKAMTVTGPVAPDELGVTAPHEHLLLDMCWATDNINETLNDEDLAVEEAMFFQRAGGSTIVDVTPICLRRNPEGLRRIAERTGLNIIMGCGWYHVPWYPPNIDRRSTNDLADEMIRDLSEGVGEAGIKAGIIGEIGVKADYIAPAEERVLRAAARACKATGAAVTTHAYAYPVGLDQLDILLEEGADPTRVVIGHADSCPDVEYHEAVARKGAYVQYDGVGRLHQYSDEKRVSVVLEMIKRGYVENLLLSTDRCWRSDLHAYGGFGYDHVLATFVPMLKEAGVSDEDIHTMTVVNPARMLSF